MRHQFYILEGRKVKRATTREWALFMERRDDVRVVARTDVGGFHISTVFIGLDHNFSPDGPPVLWETMVFDDQNGRADFEQVRCAGSWDQAEEMHRRMVEQVEQVCGIERVKEVHES